MKYQNEFNDIAKQTGNRYVALQDVIAKARSLSNSVNNRILPSEAISWAVTNESPQRVKDGSVFKKHVSEEEQILNDQLAMIEDSNIRRSVRSSFTQSLVNDHLVYIYDEKLNEFEQSRVRVIMNILWSKIRKKERY